MSEWIWVIAGYLGVLGSLALYVGSIHRRSRQLSRQIESEIRRDDR